jgi:hypothetical protein
METTLAILHVVCVAALLAAHGIFFFRGLAIEARRFTPKKIDRLARSLSLALLPAAALSGLISGRTSIGSSLLHLLLGLSPLIAVPLVFFGRVLLKKRRQAPWLLPAINLILLFAAALTGVFLWR